MIERVKAEGMDSKAASDRLSDSASDANEALRDAASVESDADSR